MISRGRALLTITVMCLIEASAAAQGRTSLKPVFKEGQQDRYRISAVVETIVTPAGSDGLSSNLRRELSAVVFVRTARVGENGEADREAIIEESLLRVTENGVERKSPQIASKSKIEFTLNLAGGLLKCSLPQEGGALAEILFALTGWYPHEEVAVGDSWRASGQGPFYSSALSEISKGATTAYRLASMSDDVAAIEGAVSLNQSGASLLTTKEGPLNVNVIAKGSGTTRFEYDAIEGRLLGGRSESRFEGKLAHIEPSAAGQKMRSREGTLIETTRFSISVVRDQASEVGGQGSELVGKIVSEILK
jgi:hypothetical protein